MTISDAIPVQFWGLNCETFNELSPFGTYDACFCQPWECDDEIKIQFKDTTGQSFTLVIIDEDDNTLDTLSFSETSTGVYYRSFLPSLNTPDICDVKVYFEIRRAGNFVAKSDCQYIKQSWEDTILINYSNHRNFAGIEAQNTTPDITFDLRVPAVFWEDRFPETDRVTQLSNNRLISLNSQLKVQRKLETDYLPIYFHKKIQLALKFQFMSIDGVDYVKEEAYEVVESEQKQYKLRVYTCWLTEKEYVVRNVL